MIEPDDMTEALDRIARTADGQLFYRFLQKTLMRVSRPEAAEGALRQLEGRRMFASELMGLMAKGIEENDRHAVCFASRPSADPDAKPRTRGARRRVTADTRVAGWDTDAGPGPGSKPGTGSSESA